MAIERAGQLGDGWLGTPSLTADEAKSQIELYRNACPESPGTCPIRRDIFIAASESEAKQFKEQYAGYRGFKPEALAIGTIDQVAGSFVTLGEMGYSDIIVRNMTNDQNQALDSISRLGELISQI